MLEDKSDTIRERLIDLVGYVEHMVRLGEKPVFALGEYRQLAYHEATLKGRIGIRHDQSDEDGPIWLSVDRLKRIYPPDIPEEIKPWITVSPDPLTEPVVVAVHTETIPKARADELIDEGILDEEDVQPALRSGCYGEEEEQVGLSDVIFRLESLPDIETSLRSYLQGLWREWAEEEKPRRETIKIYDGFFSLQQSIQSMDGEKGLEVVWGMGMARWRLDDGHTIDHPIVEQLVEIDMDTISGRINIRSRPTEPQVALKPFFALENPGADQVHAFTKEFFANFTEEQDLSPFNDDTFVPILREAASRLHGEARYHADDIADITDRTLPPIDETLRVTDTWVIFARKRSDNFYLNDLERLKKTIENKKELPEPAKRLVTEPSSQHTYTPIIGPGISGPSGGDGGGFPSPPVSGPGIEVTRTDEFFFPKPFNDDQISISRRLNEADGVVVQGPPGTGKTHTIANIICHYLATGRRVLVTSKGEAALTVLREHIPEGIRNLTISLLTNERAGLKQLEQAVSALSNTATQMNPRQLEREILSDQERILSLRAKIKEADQQLGKWADRHLKRIGDGNGILPMELAQKIVGDRERHSWLPDSPGPEANYEPRFTDEDMAAAREARKALGENLVYLGKDLPSLSDLPDTAVITAIHEDLVNAKRLEEDLQNRNAPVLSLSAERAIERADQLLKSVERVAAVFKDLEGEPWLLSIFKTWRDKGMDTDEVRLFNARLPTMSDLAEQRQLVVSHAVTLPEGADRQAHLLEAVNRAADGSRPFGLVAIGKSEARALYQQIRIESREPHSAEEWSKVADTIRWRRSMAALAIRWKAIAAEYGLPQLDDDVDKAGRWLATVASLIGRAVHVLHEDRNLIEDEVSDLFPYGMSPADILHSRDGAESAAESIRFNLSKNRLTASRDKIGGLLDRLAACSGPIVDAMKDFVANSVGDGGLAPPQVTDRWSELCSELSDILAHRSPMNTVERVAQTIAASGAPKWAEALRIEPVTGNEDPWTPGDWRETWRWQQQETYLKQIDGREEIRELSERRLQYEDDLRKTFHKVVENRTFLSLKKSMTEQVEAALVMFAAAVRRIGKGTGIRAHRFRRDARAAMKKSYSAVPCWIMPSWRISESLPADLGSFDLVIVDEASQSDIGALPALLRGKKVLIVGDDKQVSPTPVGLEERRLLQLKHNFLQGQPFASMVLPGGSLYDLAGAVFAGRRIMLHEHFRCVESIIRFSMQFYTEPIIPLRIAKASERLDPPLIDVYIPHGHKSRRQINVAEADAIVDEIEKITGDPKYEGRTIGVVCLIDVKQAHHIQTQLLSRIGEEAYVAHDITCGNPATFQGKERDIMFVSMVECSATKNTKTTTIFEQRYNVALSRARDRMYLFRSVDEDELRPDDLKAKVIRHFKSPMKTAVADVKDLIELCDSEFEREVFRRLGDLGYRVTPQVKVAGYSIDLVVEGDQDRRLAIELDGDKSHPPEQWADDLFRQRTMERVGWRFWRCWGSSFYLDPEDCMADLINTLDSRGIKPLGGEAPRNVYTEHRTIEEPTTVPVEPEVQREPRLVEADIAPSPPEVSGEIRQQEISRPEMPTEEEESVEVGDRVLIDYNDEAGRQHTIRISDTEHKPDLHIIQVNYPLAQALLGATVDEELEIPAGDGKRIITVVGIEKETPLGPVPPASGPSIPMTPSEMDHVHDGTSDGNAADEEDQEVTRKRQEILPLPKAKPQPTPSRQATDTHSILPYKAWSSLPLPDPRKMPLHMIADRLVEIIEAEGPVVLHRVFRLYATAAGIHRVRSPLRKRFLSASEIVLTSGRIEKEGSRQKLDADSVVWPAGARPVVLRKRDPRNFEEIPPSEVAELMQSIFITRPKIQREELYRRVLDFYDLKRLTSKVRDSLDKITSDKDLGLIELDASKADDLPQNPKPRTRSKYEFELLGEIFLVPTQVGILETVLRELHELDQKFLLRLSQEKGRTRPIIARSPNGLYPGKPGLSHLYQKIANGWFIGTNHAGRDVYRMLKVACNFANLDFGTDLCGPAIEKMMAKFS